MDRRERFETASSNFYRCRRCDASEIIHRTSRHRTSAAYTEPDICRILPLPLHVTSRIPCQRMLLHMELPLRLLHAVAGSNRYIRRGVCASYRR